ncbi:MAG TPA: hypothetical protein VFU63_11810 [Ktedonobacterales bacterium]|nr:hypothetical protein [Ktedonobacterales bacterium]
MPCTATFMSRTRADTATCDPYADAVYSVAWSPNGLRIAPASNHKTVRVWQPE